MTLDAGDDEMLRIEVTARLLRNTQQLEVLTENMLDAASHARGETLRPRRVSLRSLAHDIVNDVALTLGTHSVDVHGAVAYASADPYAVRRVLSSLLTNAAHYSPDGTPIDVQTSTHPNGRVSIAVSDAGPGIPEEDRDVVFEPFWRGKDARQQHRGLGVGLSIARDLCVMSGGDIRVRTAANGHGACFEVDLPGTVA
jgi:signal transduction histidine kinase